MDPLIMISKIKFKSFLQKKRRGAAVLETVILIIVAIVIVGIIVSKFVGTGAGDKNSFLGRIFGAIENIFNLQPNSK